MSYLDFLVLFVVIPLVGLVIVFRRQVSRRQWQVIGILCVMAVVWTTPWDNFLVANNVWWYDDQRVLGILLGYVPLEEYAFFVLQTMLTGVWVAGLMAYLRNPAEFQPLSVKCGIGIVVALSLVVGAMLADNDRQWNYLILELGWLALPPLAVHYIWGLDIIIYYWRIWLPGVVVPTIWLCIMDSLAIQSGVWTIDPAQTLPFKLGGILPFEEAVFFLLTNIFIVQGKILILVPESWNRLYALQSSLFHRHAPTRPNLHHKS